MSEHCATCHCADTWPELPDDVVGQQIRYRKVLGPPMTSRPVRLGGAEPKVIVAETRAFVIYRVWSPKGKDLGERCMTAVEFDEEFERRER